MGLRYCTYCRCNKAEEGFKVVRDPKSGRKTNSKCGDCCKWASASEKVRDERGARIREDRKAAAARKLDEINRRRNEGKVE